MKKIFAGFFILLFTLAVQAQMIVTDPVIPLVDQPIVIYFHSDLNTGDLKNYTLPLYAHTGVNLTDGTLWQNVIGSWGNNTQQPMLEYQGSYTYKLTITPDVRTFYTLDAGVQVKQVALVIRSADGSKQTKPDIFLNVYDNGLNISFTTPAEKSLIVNLNESVPVTANASLSDSIALYQNGIFIGGTNSSQELSHTFTASSYGENMVVAKAFTMTETAADTFYYFVRPAVTVENLPDGINDGINYISDNSIVLCLYAPSKSYVFAEGDFSDWRPGASTYMKRTPDGLRYWIELDGLQAGKEYAYQYLVDGNLRVGDPYTDKVLDPDNDGWITSSTYPNLKPYPKNKTTGIVSVFQTAQTPYTWKHNDYVTPPKEKAVIYELLVRDFVANHDWKTITDTLNYFSRLGVSALEIMPFNEFEGNESWGYNPSYYFAPDKYYGPKNDLKAFVDSCHARGIAVIMDMVLNHSFGQSPMVQLYWNSALSRPAANSPWFNEVSPNPVYYWGSDFNHEKQATKDFVDRVTSYWMTEYRIDGYRFDFSKGFTNTPGDGGAYDASRITILKRIADKIWEVNPKAYVILEHFTDNSEEMVLANYGMMLWGNINYNYAQAAMGWNDAGASDLSRVSYKNRSWSLPGLVGYMESHDEERLMYRTLNFGNSSSDYDTKELPNALKRAELAAAFFIPVPGPKMIWQFGEMGYDISIDFNGRVGNKPTHWEYLQTRSRLNPVYSALIHLKSQEPAFSTTNFSISLVNSVKRIELNDPDMDVRIIGNFDVIMQAADPDFSKTGTWYEYLTGESIQVSDVNAEFVLQPGEYRIYTTKALATPDLPNAIKEETLVKNDLSVYPNPAGNWVNIKATSVMLDVKLIDMEGRIVKTMRPMAESSTIDISDLQAGVYFLKVQQKNNSLSIQKIVRK